MANGILIGVLLMILSGPSKEAHLRFKRDTNEPSINDGVSQKGVNVSVLSPGQIKDGIVDRGFQLRSVANGSSNNALSGQTNNSLGVDNTTPKNTSADSRAKRKDDDVDERDLYNLLNRIIILILKAINRVNSNKDNSFENKFNEMNTTKVMRELVSTSQPTGSDNAITSITTSSTLSNSVSAGLESSTQNVTPKNDSHTRLLRENRIGKNGNPENGTLRDNNLEKSDSGNVLARAASPFFTLDTALEEQNPESDPYLEDDDSNFVDFLSNQKEWRETRMQRISDTMKRDLDNLKNSSDSLSGISPVPKQTRDVGLGNVPGFRDSDREEEGGGEEEEGDSPEIVENGYAENKPAFAELTQTDVNRRNRNVNNIQKRRNSFSPKGVDKNASKNKPHKNSDGNKGEKSKNISNNKLCKSATGKANNGNPGALTFVCSFTIEINKGDASSVKQGKDQSVTKKKTNKHPNVRGPDRHSKPRYNRHQYSTNEDERTHRVREGSNSLSEAREEQMMRLLNQETPDVIKQKEYFKKADEEMNDADDSRRQGNLSTDKFDRDIDEHGDTDNLSENENSASGNLDLLKSIGNKNSIEGRGHPLSEPDRLNNNMLEGIGQYSLKNSLEESSALNQQQLEEDSPGGNINSQLFGEKDEVESSLENIPNDKNLNSVFDKKQEKYSSAQATQAEAEADMDALNQRISHLNEKIKYGDAEENTEHEFNNDYHETENDSDLKINSAEEGEEEEGGGGGGEEREEEGEEEEEETGEYKKSQEDEAELHNNGKLMKQGDYDD